MNSRAIWGTAFAAVFVLSMIMVPAFAVGHVILDPLNTVTTVAGNSLKAKITVTVPISVTGTPTNFGYGIFTGSPTNNVLAIATHLPLDDSSFENPVSGFHTHVLDLTTPDASCPAGSDAEIDLTNSPLNTGFDVKYPFKIVDKSVILQNANVKHLNSGTVSSIAAFTITGVTDGGGNLHLCLDVKSSVP